MRLPHLSRTNILRQDVISKLEEEKDQCGILKNIMHIFPINILLLPVGPLSGLSASSFHIQASRDNFLF